MSKYTKRDAGRDTRSTPNDVSRAWHEARDDARARDAEPGDRPSEANRQGGRELTERVMDRARERSERERGERER